MGLWSDLVRDFREIQKQQMLQMQGIAPEVDGPSTRRPLTEDDVSDFERAAADRDKTMKPKTRDQVRSAMFAKNPVRMARIESDFRWMQRQMKKFDLNPEDARHVL